MSIYIDRKYLGLIQFRLEGFQQKKTDLYVCRCPFCLDSRKSKTKKRGYIYKLSNVESYAYRCHNCGKSISLSGLLKFIDPEAYKQYVFEKYCSSSGEKTIPETLKEETPSLVFTEQKKINLSSIYELPVNHYARDYIIDRDIPYKFWKEIYYTDNFKEFIKETYPQVESEDIPSDDRVILLYTAEDGVVTHVAGRALSNNYIRYMTLKVGNAEKKIFGTHRIDLSKPAFVVEGQFDSMFVDNCVATGDSSLSTVPDYFGSGDWTLIYDNERRNREIVRNMEKAIDSGFKVVIFPDNIEQKDINDMWLAGVEVNRIIKENTFKGIEAKMKFTAWRRV